jgi:hypothetical protein
MIWPNPNSRLNNDSIESSWLSARWHNGWSKLKQALGLRTQKESRKFSGENTEQKNPDQKSALEWTCHVCGKLRPDDKINVYSRVSTRFGVELTENVRYCNDNPDCFERAKTFTFLSEADE